MLDLKFFVDNGWTLQGRAVDAWFVFTESPITNTEIQDYYRYKPFNLWLNYGTHDGRMKIKCDFLGGQKWEEADTLFEGECTNEEDYRTITRLLHINK